MYNPFKKLGGFTMPEAEIRKTFSRNLTYYLSLKNKTQKDLMNYIHVSSSTVSNWCTGQKLPRMDKIQSISNWLGVQNSDLLEPRSDSNKQQFQYDSNVSKLVTFIKENPDYLPLFDAAKNVKKEDLSFVLQMIDRLQE